jgi:hypothetical protein
MTQPVFEIAKGNPSLEDVAVLTVILTVRAAAPSAPRARDVGAGGWNDPSHGMRRWDPNLKNWRQGVR